MKSKMIEKDQDLCCSQNHNLPILMVISDKNFDSKQRLLCRECMENTDVNFNMMMFKKVLQEIEQNQERRKDFVESEIMKNVKRLHRLHNVLIQLRSNVIQNLDKLIINSSEWINDLYLTGQQNMIYSFFGELEKLIDKTITNDIDINSLIKQILSINYSWNQKILNGLSFFSTFKESEICTQLLKDIRTENQQQEIKTSLSIKQFEIPYNSTNKQFVFQNDSIKFSDQQQVEFKFIEHLGSQVRQCWAIVFNKTGSIMVSTDNRDIKIWNFTQGRLKLQNTFQVHKNDVKCLVYSKKFNSFISGSLDQTIICWKQINQNDWKWSFPIYSHTSDVYCLLLNQQENELISGEHDSSIKIWNVDFINNKLTYLYSLNKQSSLSYQLSLNQSETMMVQCNFEEFTIWEKGQTLKWCFKYKKPAPNGLKVLFLNDYQFLWVTRDKNIDQILVFEQVDGVFIQNYKRKIQLLQNDQCEDDPFFPIVYNLYKNMILVRHKYQIYIIRKQKDGIFSIISSLNCGSDQIYGTMTDNAKYLVCWVQEQQQYSIFQLFEK
ncbi:unnamed protein product [Paramecium sonneborni]|uniref:Uncharacterized protein n=1 Tax=Paramecium sonneborni TaxID=65129 RepID=A0A8S1PF94_9CILI|nr:unnamed protein product [Paramecium sonneborni]